MFPDVWDQWSLRLIVTLLLMLGGFLPLLYSVKETYFVKDKQSKDKHE